MKILITAGNSFIGSRLSVYLQARGHTIVETARRPASNQVRFVLGDEVRSSLVSDFDAIIHAAHDFDSADRTLLGTRQLFEAARQSEHPPRQLFIGSYSARPDAVSEYGQVKYQLERIFLDANETIIRPGLVIGNGGLFARNLRTVMNAPIIPLLNGGRDDVPIISIDDLARSTALLLEGDRTGAWNLFHSEIPSMRDIVKAIGVSTNRRPLIVSVPVPIALAAIRLLSRLGIPLPFREDNIRSLAANRTRIHQSDLGALGVEPQSLIDAVRAAVESLSSRAS